MKSVPNEELLLHAPNISVHVRLGTVSIEITCADDYQAQVLFDDLADRLKAGQAIMIEPAAHKRRSSEK